MGICCMTQGIQTGTMQQLGEMGKEMGGTFKREGTYILVADSCCCMEETNTTLQSNYPPIKSKLKKECVRRKKTIN